MKQFDPFEIVTLALTAQAFIEPLGPSLHVKMSPDEANGELISAWDASGFVYEPPERVSLVYDGKDLVGWYSIEMYDSDLAQIRDAVRTIYPSEIVSADTPAFKLLRLVAERPKSGIILFVLDHEAIVGTVSPTMLASPVFRLCLFSLTLELENAALNAAMRNPIASWNALPPGRRAKAKEVHNRLHGKERVANSPGDRVLEPLLASTMFSDKGKIVAKRKLLRGWSRARVESLFALAEEVRNGSAHTRDDQPSPLGFDPKRTVEFVDLCTAAISHFRATAIAAERS